MYKIYSFHWIRIHLCINGGRIYFIIIMICVPLPSHILDMSVMNIEHRIGTLHRYHHPLTYCHLAELQQRWSRTEILLRRSCRWVQCKCIHRFFGYNTHTKISDAFGFCFSFLNICCLHENSSNVHNSVRREFCALAIYYLWPLSFSSTRIKFSTIILVYTRTGMRAVYAYCMLYLWFMYYYLVVAIAIHADIHTLDVDTYFIIKWSFFLLNVHRVRVCTGCFVKRKREKKTIACIEFRVDANFSRTLLGMKFPTENCTTNSFFRHEISRVNNRFTCMP